MRVVRFLVLALGCPLLASLTASAWAQSQIPNGIPQGLLPGFGLAPNGPFQFGGGGAMNGGVTSQQFGNLLELRALQGMGRHGVQTGVPNPVMNGYGSPPGIMPSTEQYPSASSGKGKHKSSHAKRDAARAEKAEQKRLAAAAKSKPKVEKASKKSRKEKSL
jgi:hypothetical protein